MAAQRGQRNRLAARSLMPPSAMTGSPAWLSPEQANLDELSAASDVFSLGSLLVFAATARPPFGQGATVAVLMNIQRGEPDLGGIDPARKALLTRMLAKDPAKRPTAREVLDIARAVESGADNTVDLRVPPAHTTQPIRTAPVAPAQTAVGGWRKPAAIVAAGLLALVVGFLGFNALDGDSTSPTGPDATQSQSDQTPQPQEAPAFPGSDQLRSGDWLLSQYAISQDNGKLVINGTVQNSGSKAASTDLTVYYYVDGQAVAVATGSTGEVAPGASANVTLTSDDAWQPGNPVLVVEAS